LENIIYKTEDEYKKDIVNALEKDFILIPEAKIVWPHPAIKGRKADFIIHPKEHLVKNGFDAGIIAIEVKSPICKNGESVKKILNGFYQAHSYALCQYNDSHIDFALLYPSVQCFLTMNFNKNTITMNAKIFTKRSEPIAQDDAACKCRYFENFKEFIPYKFCWQPLL